MSAARNLRIADIFGQAIDHARSLGFTTGEIVVQMQLLLKQDFLDVSRAVESSAFPRAMPDEDDDEDFLVVVENDDEDEDIDES
jgi:hypothetical protein